MTRMWRRGVALVAALAATEGAEALACGGCFAPPGAVTVVTDHRMAFSMSATQTTLWDQFAFTGRASEFSWILPIRYAPSVRVALADERFLTFLHNLSVPSLTPPYVPFPSCGMFPSADAGAVFDSAASDVGVTVYREETVGPYAVAILGGSDPMAVRDWLSANGFTVPTAVAPVLDYYVGLRMDFVALRLRAGATTGMITPVRVTVPGATPSLPLRMIAAGIADRVGLSLMVLAPSRVEAMNFPNGEVRESELTYDFASPTDPSRDFLDAFNRLNAANGQRLWLTESSFSLARTTLDFLAMTAPPLLRDGGVSSSDDSGVGVMPDLREDISVAFDGLGASARLTRMRADMPAAMLDRDLLLAASDNTAERSRSYSYGVVRNRPPPPTCPDAGDWIDASPPLDAAKHEGVAISHFWD